VTHEEIQDLLGAYALDAVEPDEVAAIEDHLRECPRCRAEVAEHREAAAFLAHAGADAPPAVWDRIAASIDAPADVVSLSPRLGFGARRQPARWQRAVAAITAAAAAVVIAVLGAQVVSQDRRIDEMETAMRVPDGEVVDLTGEGGVSVPVVLAGGRAFLLGAALDELPEGRTYQLWGAAGEELVSVAVLGRDPGVVSFDVEGYSLLAITEELAPGVVTSANQPLVAGSLA